MSDAIALLMQGGWSMIPLAICSIAGLTVVLERLVALRRGKSIPEVIVDLLALYKGEESVESSLDMCRNYDSPFARIVQVLIHARQLDHAQMIELLHSNGRKEVERLERGLLLLEVIAGISPLIGLLGTVLGMVNVFDAITEYGLGDAQVLSDGISKALITTVAGLSVAIPALAFHSFLSKKVDSIAIEMQELSVGFLTKLIRFQKSQ
jgi:biopolymer transport protein ExbB